MYLQRKKVSRATLLPTAIRSSANGTAALILITYLTDHKLTMDSHREQGKKRDEFLFGYFKSPLTEYERN